MTQANSMKKNDPQNFVFDITTLAGARFKVFRFLSKKYGVEKEFISKWRLSGFLSIVCTLLSVFDKIVYQFKKKSTKLKDPVFIIGHWRSGTTLLHNLMCLDPETGYTTTYQTIFPNNLFSFQWLFKLFMKKLMPDKRPVDNVSLHVDFPQEEEFALNNEIPFSFYNWWYFPKKTREIANEYLFNKTTSDADNKEWSTNFKRFVNRSLLNTNGNRFVSKNPPHTARISQLLKLYPTAKFIYIHRNPYEVIRSTFAFYKSILPATQLQAIDNKTLLDDILWVYKGLVERYEEDKGKINSSNLVEIRYSDLVNNPTDTIKGIYKNLLEDDFERVEDYIEKYLGGLSHKLKKYEYDQDFLAKVNDKIEENIKFKGYEVLN